MNTIKAIAFDIDGTLFSSEGLLEKVYSQSIAILNQKYGLAIVFPTQSQISPQLGKPNNEIYKILFPALDQSLFKELKELNSKHFSFALQEFGGTIFDGTNEMLDDLKKRGILLYVASNGAIGYLTSIINKYNLTFDTPVVTLDYTSRFVKADILAEYLSISGLAPQEMMMVGDRIMDLEAAKAHKIPFIGIKGKTFGETHELKGSDYLVNDVKEAHQLLISLISQ